MFYKLKDTERSFAMWCGLIYGLVTGTGISLIHYGLSWFTIVYAFCITYISWPLWSLFIVLMIKILKYGE